jgi:hypothetical protein
LNILKSTFMILLLCLNILSCEETKMDAYVPPPSNSDDEKAEGDVSPLFNADESQWPREASELTSDFTNFPSSSDVNNYINTSVSSPSPPCPSNGQNNITLITSPGVGLDNEVNFAAQGARRLLASFYQSCKAIDITVDSRTPSLKGITKAKIIDGQRGVSGGYLRKVINKSLLVKSHKILSKLDKDPEYPGPECKDATERPPIYGYGSRAFPNRSGTVKIFKKGGGVARTSQNASGIDCSAFIATALGSQGLKVSTSSGPFTANTTRSFHGQLSKSNSCLKKAIVTPEDIIRAGDMLNVAGSHIIMIDQVGKDPLGIEKYAAIGSCTAINPAEFNFTYIHSGSIKGSYGPSRVKANMHRSGTMWNNLRQIAVKMCQKKIENNSVKTPTASLAGISSKFSLIRHQSSNPACLSDKRIKIEGEDCINKCENIKQDV